MNWLLTTNPAAIGDTPNRYYLVKTYVFNCIIYYSNVAKDHLIDRN